MIQMIPIPGKFELNKANRNYASFRVQETWPCFIAMFVDHRFNKEQQSKEGIVYTPFKVNMEPEHHPLEKADNLPNLHFW